MIDSAFYISAIEKWFVRNDATFQDVEIIIYREDPLFRKTRVKITIKTHCQWDQYTEVLKSFKTYIKRVFIPMWSHDVSITVLHTKKIAA